MIPCIIINNIYTESLKNNNLNHINILRTIGYNYSESNKNY